MKKYAVACYYDPPKRTLRVEMTRMSDNVVVVNMARDLREDESLETALDAVFQVFVRYGAMSAAEAPVQLAAAMDNFRATVAN